MENVVLIVLLSLIMGTAVFYILRAKKKGQKCIGCPYSGSCSGCGGKQ